MLRLRGLCFVNCSNYQCYSTKTFVNNESYQFYPKSEIPMLHFQKSLPRLPIPELEKTAQRYLSAQNPLLSVDAYVKTEKIVNNFITGDGLKLQEMLKAHNDNNKTTSYISAPWFDMYLKDRVPLPLNYNPLIILNYDSRDGYNRQSIRATNLIISSLRFYRSLERKTLAPEIFHLNPRKSDTNFYRNFIKFVPSAISTYVSYAFKAYPLDMSQYEGLFCSTRIPEIDKDRIQRYKSSRHVIVLRNGHIYTIRVLNSNGEIENPSTIFQRINFVLQDNRKPSDNPIGILTTDNRNHWARVRKYLEENGNAEQLRQVDSALYCICLDNDVYDQTQPTSMISNLLYNNGENRWFDKSFSLIVSKDGTSAVNFEHSWGDGVAVLRFIQDSFRDSVNSPFIHPGHDETSTSSEGVEYLEFKIDETIRKFISESKSQHDNVVDSVTVGLLKKDGIGRKSCKKIQLSPDFFMQLGFQLAFYKQNSRFVATYESCSTAAFLHGRTETIRPCTSFTKEICINMMRTKNSLSKTDLAQLILKASKYHSMLTKEAAMGQGFDRHLFGLKHRALASNMELPELYLDEAYANINNNILSTSTLSSPAVMGGGFGPTAVDGYGIGYNIQDNGLGAIITCNKAKRNVHDFINCLDSSYVDIQTVFL